MALSQKPPLGELSISDFSSTGNLPNEKTTTLAVLPVTESGDGPAFSQPELNEQKNPQNLEDENADKENVGEMIMKKKFQKKKTRGTRGGVRNREKRKIRENRQRLGMEQLSPIKKEIQRQESLKTFYRYTPEKLIRIREICSSKVPPPLVLAPISMVGIEIFPVKYVPEKNQQRKAPNDDRTLLVDEIQEIISKVREVERKPLEGRKPYFMEKLLSMKTKEMRSNAAKMEKERQNLENSKEKESKKENKEGEREMPPNGKYPMRPPMLASSSSNEINSDDGRHRALRKSFSPNSDWNNAEAAYSGMYCAPCVYPGVTWYPVQYYPVYAPVYAPVYPSGYRSPPMTSSSSESNISRRSSTY